MKLAIVPTALTAFVAVAVYAATAPDSGPSDPQIAHIAYTAGVLDVAAAKLALERSRNPAVRAFAETMVRDHEAVNLKALDLVNKLRVTPEANPVSAALTDQSSGAMKHLAALNGTAFDRAYVRQEAAFHKVVNTALRDTLIPAADNGELKSLLQSGLALFSEHQSHAEGLSASLR